MSSCESEYIGLSYALRETIPIMEMLKDQAGASHDKALMDAYDFLSQYLKAHSHFIILGAKFPLSNLLKEMKMKPRIPSTILNQTKNIVLSIGN